MKSKSNERKKGLAKRPYDMLAWLAITFLLAGGIVANYHYQYISWALRAAMGLVVVSVVLALVSSTLRGKAMWGFLKVSRSELRKVVWPTRQETYQVTWLVVGVVFVMVLILWGVDSIFMWLVSWLTEAGQ